MTTTSRLIAFLFICFSFASKGQNPEIKKKNNSKTEWVLANLLHEKSNNVEINGKPQIVASPYGEAISFNGTDDAFFLNELPLQSLQEFTVEMIFKPELNGLFEQRILHIGESTKDRMLLEIRAVGNNWYFDGYAASGTNKKALIDEKLIHPLEQWYHVAFVVTPKSLTTFVNGKQELQEDFSFLPIQSGQTSIGVRMNKVCWFKGAIYKIRITPKQVNPIDFMSFIK
ncbi:Concanavalin A-like lectin/glucanases superfamily protein [Flavobacterium fluvii]|uniref:Concanavalin A-like lectin/glucanases superfamily protein n=1 Tax=Flavobacterium fluvii TaxID=468056 RepID=A0A1M5HTQ4_9FLAO|nr:LamG-like jellyroll fold domain-containing protein [Flavobacterium fluvii]SHG19351.1 Concanavalin A-like lectin/glucanases superfamily protein [Flavobacterium fluvii]